MRTVSFKLSDQLDATLSDLARRRKLSRSALFREAIELLAKGSKRCSVTAMVDESTPTLEGPSDLSTNLEYMTGYGK